MLPGIGGQSSFSSLYPLFGMLSQKSFQKLGFVLTFLAARCLSVFMELGLGVTVCF